MKILIGDDGSPYSDAAIDEVARRKWPEGSEIRVVHAYQIPLAPTPEVWVLPNDYYDQLDRAIRQQADAIVEAAVAKLKLRLASFVSIQGEAILGSAKGVLVDEAETWSAD